MKIAVYVIATLIIVVVLAGCNVQGQADVKLPNKHWQDDFYRRISNVYDPDFGNYAIVEVEAKAGESKIGFSLGNDRPMTFRPGDKTAYRSLPREVKYPDSSQLLEVREIYLMRGKTEVAYAHRRW